MTREPPSACQRGPEERTLRSAHLRYATDAQPGIRRERQGETFGYLGLDEKPVRDADMLARIKSLAIPPAWTDVWIAPDPDAHLQATGRDARGRKQYRYHARWREVRDEAKYERLAAFSRALPEIRKRINADLSLPGVPRNKVLATLIYLLQSTLIRVGNEEYARANQSYGLTTMRDHHVDFAGARMRFGFRGKSGKSHVIELTDRRLQRVVRRCRDIPGERLFQYADAGGEFHAVESADVNNYLREVSGEDFTAKDFRTWSGTVLAAWELMGLGAGVSQAERKRNINAAIDAAAARLGNTRAICRKCYVHPAVLQAYAEGTLGGRLRACSGPAEEELSVEETAIRRFLEHL